MARTPLKPVPNPAEVSEGFQETTDLLQPSQGGGEEEMNHLSRDQVLQDISTLSGEDKISYCLKLMARVPNERVLFGQAPVHITMGDLREAFE